MSRIGKTHFPKAFANAPKAAAAAAAPQATTAAADDANVKVLGINTTLTMPSRDARRTGGFKSKYGFENMEVGTSIGVVGRSAKTLASTISGANRRFRVEKRDEKGAIVYEQIPLKDATGNVTSYTQGPALFEQQRHFFAIDTDPKTDPEGATARIWRDK